jgi:hypothetical protein
MVKVLYYSRDKQQQTDRTMTSQRYYIQQFGYYWSLNKDEFKQVLTSIINGNGYDLSEFKQLKSKPSDRSTHYGSYIFNTLDWDKSTAQYEFEYYFK